MAGPVAHLGEVGAERGDVADLAAGLDGLAVHVDADAGVAGHAVQVAAVHVGCRATEDIHHDGHRRGGGRGSERQVEDRAEVLLELTGAGALDGPVAGIVRAHGQLVDLDAAVRGLEHLDGHDSGHAEQPGNAQRDVLCLDGQVFGQVGGGGVDLVADAVALDGLHHGVDGRLPHG